MIEQLLTEIRDSITSLMDSYQLVDLPSGTLRVIQSLSYGEAVIAILLGLLIVLYILKWIWEALR
ncbi:hypothetical protein [Paenibacillus sp. NAIST15-1]|uniref:hypothetical protein n=1 Tax=Paenibacillus sp. NAIST15-1 TaxID=1605994 RepID=UPI00086D6BF9|nr:hypothetical protein [Paenibacillus sp. NAIST15-1]GAV16090.1 hypothetical protein PBN151_6075 [Paenibacillus sp. NAIST15-1]